MRDKASPGTLLSWLTVAVGGAAMVGVFALAGGIGNSQDGVSSAIAAGTGTSSTDSSTSNTSGGIGPMVSALTTPVCAGTTLHGGIIVTDKSTGSLTLGLFAISDPAGPLVRSFTDTGLRETVHFNGAYRGSFTFDPLPGGSAGYLVAVIPPSGTIDSNTQTPESQVVPTCDTATTTVTDTQTTTISTTGLTTITGNSYQTVSSQIRRTDTNTSVRTRFDATFAVTVFTTTTVGCSHNKGFNLFPCPGTFTL